MINKSDNSNDRWDLVYNKKFEYWDEYSRYQDKNNKALKELLKFANFSNKIVLEVGCGSGMYTANLARISKQYFAVDKSLPLIKLAQKKYNDTHKIQYLNLDALKLPFENNKFDIVFSSWGFPHENEGLAQKEFERVLKNTGEIWLITNYPKGEFMRLRGKLEAGAKEDRFVWFSANGYELTSVVTSKFDFPNPDRAKFILKEVFGDDVYSYLDKHKNPNITREIAILHKKVLKG